MMANECKKLEFGDCLKEFLNDNSDASEKLKTLIMTVENIENEYRFREKQRINDLQLIVNNAYSSKGMLRYTKDYKRQLNKKINEMTTQIDEMDKELQELASDLVVYDNRYNEFSHNVVGLAEECLWGMDKLFNLLNCEKYDDEDENYEDIKEQFGDSSNPLAEFTDIGSLGLKLSFCKKEIDENNAALDDFARKFQQIRYSHSMQFYHDKDAYILYRKNADLDGHETKSQASSNPVSPTKSNDNYGMLIDLDDKSPTC